MKNKIKFLFLSLYSSNFIVRSILNRKKSFVEMISACFQESYKKPINTRSFFPLLWPRDWIIFHFRHLSFLSFFFEIFDSETLYILYFLVFLTNSCFSRKKIVEIRPSKTEKWHFSLQNYGRDSRNGSGHCWLGFVKTVVAFYTWFI